MKGKIMKKFVVKVVEENGKYVCKVQQVTDAELASYAAVYPDYLYLGVVEADSAAEALGQALLSNKEFKIVKKETPKKEVREEKAKDAPVKDKIKDVNVKVS